MRLAEFLETDREPILSAAADYARTIPALASTDEETLRDHLPHLLEAISADLRRNQSRTESIAKSHGRAPAMEGITSAQTHGLLRARRGITIEQLVAEFRALRSSILRLWLDRHVADASTIEDISRFNEASIRPWPSLSSITHASASTGARSFSGYWGTTCAVRSTR